MCRREEKHRRQTTEALFLLPPPNNKTLNQMRAEREMAEFPNSVRTSLFDDVPEEVEGDHFDRQRVMVSWNQRKVKYKHPDSPSLSLFF